MTRPIIAILRGLDPVNAIDTCNILIDAGIENIEVPLNSPDPFRSISQMVDRFGKDAMIGAGTVLDIADVKRLADIGAGMVVSPDCNPAVIDATRAAGMQSFPGCFTASECFTALRHGATGLKIFPASIMGPSGVAALRAVLPKDCKVYAVGGAGPDNFADWLKVGTTGFGIGTALFTPDLTRDDIRDRARAIVASYDQAAAKI